MHVEMMTLRVARFLAEANELQTRKNADYHPDKVAFLEILRTACETGVTVEQDLWGRVRKQLSALRRYVIDGHTESEPPRSRMIDVAVYMGMMAVWDASKVEVVNDALVFVNNHTRCENPDYCGTADANTVCDRCEFGMWLMNYSTKLNGDAPQVPAR